MKNSSFDNVYAMIREEYINNAPPEKLKNLCNLLSKSEVIIFGAGICGETIKERLKDQNVSINCFCDNNKRGKSPVTKTNIVEPKDLYRN